MSEDPTLAITHQPPFRLTGGCMDFEPLLKRMTGAVCAGDAEGAAACFTPEGIYHDGFYGEFKGRAEIARMLREFFYRDARDLEWRLFDPAERSVDGRVQGAVTIQTSKPISRSELLDLFEAALRDNGAVIVIVSLV